MKNVWPFREEKHRITIPLYSLMNAHLPKPHCVCVCVLPEDKLIKSKGLNANCDTCQHLDECDCDVWRRVYNNIYYMFDDVEFECTQRILQILARNNVQTGNGVRKSMCGCIAGGRCVSRNLIHSTKIH